MFNIYNGWVLAFLWDDIFFVNHLLGEYWDTYFLVVLLIDS